MRPGASMHELAQVVAAARAHGQEAGKLGTTAMVALASPGNVPADVQPRDRDAHPIPARHRPGRHGLETDIRNRVAEGLHLVLPGAGVWESISALSLGLVLVLV